MKMHNSFAIKFFIKVDRAHDGKAPIYARITVNRDFTDVSLKRDVCIKAWNQREQKLTGNDAEAQEIREKMRTVWNEINAAYDELKYAKQFITARGIKGKMEGYQDDVVSLLWLFDYHNTEMKELLEPGTMKNYYSTERYIKEFLISKKRVKDIYLPQLNYKFLVDFQIFLLKRPPDKGQRPCTNNAVMKHIERVRKIITLAVKNDWLVKDPFLKFKRQMVTKDRECLEADDLENLQALELEEPGLQITRDKFVFSCYTGLAFVDIERLNSGHIKKDAQGEWWIEMVRKKTENVTEVKFMVMLLPKAVELIEKFRDHPKSALDGTIFPKYSNQATNNHLKAIREKLNLGIYLSYHIARHTFATTVTLENGVPIESVSKMLGHKSIRTTQIYSKVKRKKLSADMMDLKQKLAKAG